MRAWRKNVMEKYERGLDILFFFGNVVGWAGESGFLLISFEGA